MAGDRYPVSYNKPRPRHDRLVPGRTSLTARSGSPETGCLHLGMWESSTGFDVRQVQEDENGVRPVVRDYDHEEATVHGNGRWETGRRSGSPTSRAHRIGVTGAPVPCLAPIQDVDGGDPCDGYGMKHPALWTYPNHGAGAAVMDLGCVHPRYGRFQHLLWLHPTPGMDASKMCLFCIQDTVWRKPKRTLGWSDTRFGCPMFRLGHARTMGRMHAYQYLDAPIHGHGRVQGRGWIPASLGTDAPVPRDGLSHHRIGTHPRRGSRAVNPCVGLAHDWRWMHSWPGTVPSVPRKGCPQGPIWKASSTRCAWPERELGLPRPPIRKRPCSVTSTRVRGDGFAHPESVAQ
jgi:hypothetical protein